MRFRTRVKICGITRLDDALNAVQAGADSLGFVFYSPSPRNLELEQARALIKSVPAFISTTALFVNPQPGLVLEVVKQTKVDLLQFHGEESAEFCRGFQRPYIKSIAMHEDTDLEHCAAEYKDARALLLDTYKPGIPGGTGETFNWDWVPSQCSMPLILAGGLTADNVSKAIAQTQAYAVDVSGGVEQAKGIKSAQKMSDFIKACY